MNVKINFSIPVTLFDYRESDNALYSFAKLKIFYVGETSDKRLFTKNFSDELIKTLPYVPVVGYYNDEKEDFEGHKSEVQYIYGMVPENTGIEYIKENGKEYAVCDVLLYTGRKDKTGEIASQIVGKQQSLELNPDDTTYVINKDENGKVQNIEFTGGSLLGLSVLGDGEKPAFGGSAFFTEDSKLLEAFLGFKEEIHKYANYITQRGEDMEDTIFESALSFLKRTYSEKVGLLYKTIAEKYGDEFYIPQVFDDNVILAIWNDELGDIEYVRLPYSENEEGDIVLGESVKVYPRYLTEDEINAWEANLTSASDEGVKGTEMQEENAEESVTTSEENSQASENITDVEENNEDEDNDEDNEDTEQTVEEDDDDEKDKYNADETSVESTEQDKGTHEDKETFSSNDNEDDTTNEEQQESQEEEETQDTKIQQETFSTTLTDSEREELESFRREKKVALIDSFKEDLSSEFLKQLTEKVDEHSFDELEIILSKEFTKTVKSDKNKSSQTKGLFSIIANSTATNDTERVKKLVKQYK